jgi:hypothetical protein
MAKVEPLWNSFDEEPWLDNPPLVIYNPRKRKRKPARKSKRGKTTMARTRRRRSTARRNVYVNPVRRKRRTRRASTLMARSPRRVNPPRRRRRRSYRRNQPMRGMEFMGFRINELLYGTGAVIIQPIAERQLLTLMPVSWSATTAGRWTAKVGSSVAIGWGARTFFGKRIGELTMLVMGSNLLADAVGEFLPALPGMSLYYNNRGRRAGMSEYVYPGQIPGSAGTFTGVYPSLVQPMNIQDDPFKAAWNQ